MSKNSTPAALRPVLGNAVAVMFFGFLFVLFTLPFMGLDLLIDAVGWVLIFNGVRVLERPNGGAGKTAIVCLILCVISGLQLFLLGTAYTVFSYLYGFFQVIFFVFSAILLYRVFTALAEKRNALFCALGFGLAGLCTCISSLSFLWSSHAPVLGLISLLGKLLFVGMLLRFCFTLRNK